MINHRLLFAADPVGPVALAFDSAHSAVAQVSGFSGIVSAAGTSPCNGRHEGRRYLMTNRRGGG
jgi:hypothetical protein